LEGLANGTVDIVIGTHRLLSRDVRFKHLGMLVIDDEHKFGVKQKEALRETRSHIDTISLSATPIPRTLYFALSSLKKVSFMQTPPQGRVPVNVHLLRFSKAHIKDAILQGLAHGGQIYFLHNRIETIARVQTFLKELVPEVSVRVMHGRMGEAQVIETMRAFRAKEFSVLLATTIIESGLDIPSVNTMIVDGAEKLGLAQAYQIKGRIGRSRDPSNAYFFFQKKLSQKANARLGALKEAESLGSGYTIALRDMEIRGAGNMLGKEQSGSVNKVGLNLYCQLLSEAVEKLRAEKVL
jgi:transcription-repair coupling factor (superfamily II helicase)